jgi:uncharacterized membrane protein YphA (DoxX/SURF4 family)
MPEYEFDEPQSAIIGDLSRKMGLVGFVFMLFGILHIAQGIMLFIASRSPEIVAQIEEAAKAHGAKVQQSTFPVMSASVALGGLFLLLVGIWTRQAAGGFAAVVLTKGQDISLLMEALKALRKKYTLIYDLILLAALLSLISLGFSLWQHWRAS